MADDQHNVVWLGYASNLDREVIALASRASNFAGSDDGDQVHNHMNRSN